MNGKSINEGKSYANGSGSSHANGNGSESQGGPGRHVGWQLPPREHWWLRV